MADEVDWIKVARNMQRSLRIMLICMVCYPTIILLEFIRVLQQSWITIIIYFLCFILIGYSWKMRLHVATNKLWFVWLGPFVEIRAPYTFEDEWPEWHEYLHETFDNRTYEIVVRSKVVKFRYKKDAVLFKLVHG